MTYPDRVLYKPVADEIRLAGVNGKVGPADSAVGHAAEDLIRLKLAYRNFLYHRFVLFFDYQCLH
ncbi:MAG: hypothetical protein BHW37_01005 [Firmicutes bacterium CAG:272_52_7]|nr:MAG: hypothetical protein BHW37_01005 [Firmicutes bacterium CAG:272_52_7]